MPGFFFASVFVALLYVALDASAAPRVCWIDSTCTYVRKYRVMKEANFCYDNSTTTRWLAHNVYANNGRQMVFFHFASLRKKGGYRLHG
mmetsp:Transcript_4404/g.9861  ORF Transcript_4404/g.9861 Transcript_4404/m.9861 type:complete len:89 (+) Transcript_4404:89-355(+)